MKKFICLLVVVFVFGCKDNVVKKENNANREVIINNDSLVNISILKWATHPALDEMEQSFIKAIDSLYLLDDLGRAIKITKYNAAANKATAGDLSKSIVASAPDLVLTIATPAAQAFDNTNDSILHVFGAVADPKGADILSGNRCIGIQNAGQVATDMAFEFIKLALPDVKKVGTIFNPEEQNSIFVQECMKNSAKKYGLELIQTTCSSASQLNTVTNSLVKKVDVIYSANDNIVNVGIETIVGVADENFIPLIIGDLSTLNSGAIAAIGLEYNKMGKDLALLSYEAINQKSFKNMSQVQSPRPILKLNREKLNQLKLKLSDTIVAYMNN